MLLDKPPEHLQELLMSLVINPSKSRHFLQCTETCLHYLDNEQTQ